MKNRLILICLLISGALSAQNSKIAEKTKNWKAFDGYLKTFHDPTLGKIWWLVDLDVMSKEFLYVNSLPAGLGSNDIGLDRGQLGGRRVVFFQKIGKKLLLTESNYEYRALTSDKNEARAVRNSFAQSILFSFVVDEEDGNKVLVDATNFIVRDAHGVVERLKTMKQGNYTFDETRSAVFMENTKVFPKNAEFEAIVTFKGGEAGRFLSSVAPSTEAFSLRVHHSIVELPDADYTPRRYDIRSGYNATSFYDYASDFTEPIEKMYIARHRLKKKDPSVMRLAEPVKPIVYYLDNGTPEPIRSALLEGGRWWNQAFEAAGYKDAFRVEVLPDSADPMDIRYNVINWVHRSTRGWSYGMSVTDPRTGEIIKGQVTLGSLRVRQDYLIFTGLIAPFETGKPASDVAKQAALQRLRQLSAHEIGHTLGLMHNYASSVNDRASVMDYPHPAVNINASGNFDFSKTYTNEIGAWDKRAIMYGYSDFGKKADETADLNRILEENTRLGLLYIADADARAADGMHPQAHLWDNGKNAMTELDNTLKIRELGLKKFSENIIKNNVPMSRLEDALVPIYNYHRYQLEAVCKLIGGMDYSYSVRGDKQAQPKILDPSVQRQALDAAIECLMPNRLELPENVLKIIPPRPPQYYNIGELMPKRSGMGLDALAAAEALVSYELMFLLNPQRANRLVQFKAMDAKNLGFEDVLNTLIERLWSSDLFETGLKRQIQLQTRQMLVTHLLGLTQSEATNYAVKSLCFQALLRMKTEHKAWMADKDGGAHFLYLVERINNPKDIELPKHKELPLGAPIGCEDGEH